LQSRHPHVKVQRLPRQWVIEIEQHATRANVRHERHDCAPLFISHMDRRPSFQRHLWRKFLRRDYPKCLGIPLAVAIGRRYHYTLFVANCHPIERLLQAGYDLALTLHELQTRSIIRGGNERSAVEV